jgi:hypothetical protein
MISDDFQNWLQKSDNPQKSFNTARGYKIAIKRLSKHYSRETGNQVNIYSVKDLNTLCNIEREYITGGRFSSFGEKASGANRAAISAYVRFFRSRGNNQNNFEENVLPVDDENDEDLTVDDDSNIFTYERDLQNSLELQAEELFPGYKIFGTNKEGVQYVINEKKVDLLLEHKTENKLLVIELKAGLADFKAFGQISMYIGPLQQKYPNKEVSGIIIASKIDDSLKYACLTNDKIKLKTYQMKLSLEDI